MHPAVGTIKGFVTRQVSEPCTGAWSNWCDVSGHDAHLSCISEHTGVHAASSHLLYLQTWHAWCRLHHIPEHPSTNIFKQWLKPTTFLPALSTIDMCITYELPMMPSPRPCLPAFILCFFIDVNNTWTFVELMFMMTCRPAHWPLLLSSISGLMALRTWHSTPHCTGHIHCRPMHRPGRPSPGPSSASHRWTPV